MRGDRGVYVCGGGRRKRKKKKHNKKLCEIHISLKKVLQTLKKEFHPHVLRVERTILLSGLTSYLKCAIEFSFIIPALSP